MAKKKNQVEVYNLICEDCGKANYVVRLKKENKGIKRKKYCSSTRTHTMHKAKKA